MLGPLRSAISVAFIAGLVWFSFSVKLGKKTLAQHVDRISETHEARELVDGARDRINPTLEEAKQRILGEYIEAPTSAEVFAPLGTKELPARAGESLEPVPGREPGLPGRP